MTSDVPAGGASLAAIAEIARSGEAQVSLVLREHSLGSAFQTRLESVAQQIERAMAGAVPVMRGNTDDSVDSPALTVRVAGRDVVRYRAIPEGLEEAPFLEAFMALAGSTRDHSLAKELAALERDADLVVFVAPGCPNCPHGVRAAIALATAHPRITVTVVDATHFTQLASRFHVRSVPTTVVDAELTLVGVRTPLELAHLILEKQGPRIEMVVFASLIESGRIEDASERLVDGRAIRAFGDLWMRSTLEGRIALTLAAQQALERDRSALDDLVSQLLSNLHDDDPARRGDTADLLGEIGHPDAKPALEELCHDDDPDVAEAAADAMEGIEQRARDTAHESG